VTPTGGTAAAPAPGPRPGGRTTTPPSRLHRYEAFLEDGFAAGLAGGDEYSLEGLTPAFLAFAAGGVDRIVFTGMGCSAIVSDVLRGHLLVAAPALEVVVVNDYDFDSAVPAHRVDDPRTMIVISSYSGHSSEPVLALERLPEARDRTLVLTSGGRLAELARETGTSVAYWRLSRPDREYPLFHVTQYFAILLRILDELGALPPGAEVETGTLAERLRQRRSEARSRGQALALAARDANVLMVAPPVWHDALLKLCKMHLNEIAMVPAGRNLLNEFCHSEIATLSDPERRHVVLVFQDKDADDYTTAKAERLLELLGLGSPGDLVSARRVDLAGDTFAEKLFAALDVVQHMTLELARWRAPESRDLISLAAGNPWYHSATIQAEAADA